MRTCVGCRQIRPQGELLRTRVAAGRVAPALREVAGRSAYLCPSRRCLDEAARRGGFARAFRPGRAGEAVPKSERRVAVDADALWAALMEETIRESDRLQRSGAAEGRAAAPGVRSRGQKLQALAAAMHASGRNA
jgi:hypothetical protein